MSLWVDWSIFLMTSYVCQRWLTQVTTAICMCCSNLLGEYGNLSTVINAIQIAYEIDEYDCRWKMSMRVPVLPAFNDDFPNDTCHDVSDYIFHWHYYTCSWKTIVDYRRRVSKAGATKWDTSSEMNPLNYSVIFHCFHYESNEEIIIISSIIRFIIHQINK